MSDEKVKDSSATTDWQRVDRFRDFLDALEPAQEHFRESGRQFLLGISSSMEATSELLDDLENISATRHISSGLVLARSMVDLWVSRLPSLQNDRKLVLQARLEALFNLRAVIQAEQARRKEDESGRDRQVRDETLAAVLRGINEEIEQTVQELEQPEQEVQPEGPWEVTIGGEET